MGLAKKPPKKNPKGIILQWVKGEIHTKVFQAFQDSNERKDDKKGQPPLPLIPPRWGGMPPN
jgi:hypothetical protein